MLTQYGKKGFGEKENLTSSKVQKKLLRIGSCGWLVCAAALDCSHLRLIVNVAIGIAHAVLRCNARLVPQCCMPKLEEKNVNVLIKRVFVGLLIILINKYIYTLQK